MRIIYRDGVAGKSAKNLEILRPRTLHAVYKADHFCDDVKEIPDSSYVEL